MFDEERYISHDIASKPLILTRLRSEYIRSRALGRVRCPNRIRTATRRRASAGSVRPPYEFRPALTMQQLLFKVFSIYMMNSSTTMRPKSFVPISEAQMQSPGRFWATFSAGGAQIDLAGYRTTCQKGSTCTAMLVAERPC